jgi:hypothetical protein
METPSTHSETPLEHFELIEDVVAHIRTKLPADSGPESWRAVCEDVLHCQLPAIEPLLLKELAAAQGNVDEQEKLRGLLRAVSWYRHPRMSADEIVAQLNHLRPTHPGSENEAVLDTIQEALEKQYEGAEALKAADSVDALFANAKSEEEKEKLRQIRDQVYYQLLYPHWFEIVKNWAATQPAV